MKKSFTWQCVVPLCLNIMSMKSDLSDPLELGSGAFYKAVRSNMCLHHSGPIIYSGLCGFPI